MNTLSGFFDIKEKGWGVPMKEILDYAGTVMDIRQEKKVLHKIADIILLVFLLRLQMQMIG